VNRGWSYAVRALVLKDLLVLRKQARSMLFMLAFLLLYAVMMRSITFITFMAVIFFAMLSISSFAYDDLAKWDPYALALPISRTEAVLAKYVLAVVLALAGVVVAAVASLAAPLVGDTTVLGERMLVVYATFAIAIVFVGAMLPLIYRFGTERSRLFMIAVFALPTVVGYAAFRAGVPVPDEAMLKVLLYASPLVLAAVLWVSVLVSVRVFSAKQL